MIRRLIDADMKFEMLRPLISDRSTTERWDNTIGANGFELMRRTLYYDLIRELAAISLDRAPKAPSIENILQKFQSAELLEVIRTEYCSPLPISWVGHIDEDSRKFWEAKHKEREIAEGSVRFDKNFKKVNSTFKELKRSELFKKIKLARNKIVAHYEMINDGGDIRPFDPTDIGLKWGDAEDYYHQIQPIITELVLLTSNEAYALDSNNAQHKQIAIDFWAR